MGNVHSKKVRYILAAAGLSAVSSFSIRFQAMTTTQSLTKLWLLVLYLSITLEIKYTKGTMSMRNTNSPTEPIKFEHNTDSHVEMDSVTDVLSRLERTDILYMDEDKRTRNLWGC
jgi:hypothetical protein